MNTKAEIISDSSSSVHLFDLHELYKEDPKTPPRFKSLTEMKSDCKIVSIQDEKSQKSERTDKEDVTSDKFLIEIDGESRNSNIDLKDTEKAGKKTSLP